ncbi:MAG: hypothetical protein SGI77_24950 [Pirellulaceae bacterium]|nr:hypothetical protein [Pirellulaceae bacterium]
MNVLIIRSDLPESPEVLLLAGVLSVRSDLRWIPSPEVIVCKLIKIWAWVAEHGHQDSDSCDYRIPSACVAALECQLGCEGLLSAMCDCRVDWCRFEGDQLVFCRFGEWNGEDAMKRRGDSARARRSRSRSQTRIGRTESDQKAHAKCDVRHVSRAPSIDVDVDVSLETKREPSTSTSERAPPEDRERLVSACYETIRRSVRSSTNADAAQVAKDRSTAWKTSSIVVDRLSGEWLTRVLESLAKTKPRRPYGYLFSAISKRLSEDGLNASELYAKLIEPEALIDPTDLDLRVAKPTLRRIDPVQLAESKRYELRQRLLATGLRGDALVEAFEDECRKASIEEAMSI